MSRSSSRKWFHDMRSSLNGVICMGSLLEETALNPEQLELLRYMIESANKTLSLLEINKTDLSVPEREEPASSEKGPLRILVAEDDDINRLYLTTILKRRKWEVDEAENGYQAVEHCRSGEYGMILMDVSMPELDGFQAACKIRESGDTTPIVAITAHNLLDFQGDYLSSGVNEILRKPFKEEQLIDLIRKLTGVE